MLLEHKFGKDVKGVCSGCLTRPKFASRKFSVDPGPAIESVKLVSNANAIGFKKGVTVDEFSDDTMGDILVLYPRKVVGYINKRLGRDKNGSIVLIPLVQAI